MGKIGTMGKMRLKTAETTKTVEINPSFVVVSFVPFVPIVPKLLLITNFSLLTT